MAKEPVKKIEPELGAQGAAPVAKDAEPSFGSQPAAPVAEDTLIAGTAADSAPPNKRAKKPKKPVGFFRRLGRFSLVCLSGLLMLGIIGALVVFYAIWHYGRDLPNYEKLADYEPPIVSRVYASNGSLIGEFASEKRIFVPIQDIPDRVKNAFIAAEDQRFYDHRGIDVFGLARAAWTNVRNLGSGRRPVGGSTITQQVAKNFLLTSDKTFDRKIKEMILSFRIERTFTKDQILELYLNEIPLGNRSHGVAAAAQIYFGKALKDLTVAEAALLGGMPQAPSRYNPARNPDRAERRRNYVIKRMFAEGFITKAERDEALATKLKVLPAQPYVSLGAEYFVEDVRRGLIKKYGEKKMARGGFVVRSTVDLKLQSYADKAMRDGLVAYDRRHGWRGPVKNLKEESGARWAEGWKKKLAAIKPPAGHGDWKLALVLKVEKAKALIGFADGKRGQIPLAELRWARPQKEYTRVNRPPYKSTSGPPIRKAADVLKDGDVVLVEPAKRRGRGKPYPKDTYTLRQIPEVTGALVAMDPHTGRILAMTGGFSFWISQFNNVSQAERQPGSSFKPFVYLAGLEAGYTPSTIILDAPIVIKISGYGKYKPRNYSGKFYGPTTMRRGLELSRNLMTIRLAQRSGLDRVSDLGKRFGIAEKLPPELAMALGAYESTPLKIATAYSMLVNGGKKVVPTLVDRVQDRYGKTIFRHDARSCTGCKGMAWNKQTMPLLKDERPQIADPRHAFQIVAMLQGVVQRGTATAVSAVGKPLAGKTGTTNDAMDAWFVGFSPDLVVAVWVGFDKRQSLGPREQGGKTAAPIFRDFMVRALAGKPATPFRVPRGLVSARVDLTNGLLAKRGARRVISEYFIPGTVPTNRGAYGPDGVQDSRSFSNNRLDGTGSTY